MTAPPPPNDDTELLTWLANRDVPCPHCNYNLRSLTTPRCPECGNHLRLSVALADPYTKPWITLAIAVCGSAGMGLYFLCLVLREGIPSPHSAAYIVFYFILTIPTPLILLKTRRRYQRLIRSAQWTISLIAVFASLCAIAILCATIP